MRKILQRSWQRSGTGQSQSRFYDGWAPYVPVAERRRQAEEQINQSRQRGQTLSPVGVSGRTIAHSFWGKSWCDNLESYSDFSNRLPRGRTYLRNGSVIDLKIAAGTVSALVQGSSLYRVQIVITPVPKPLWQTMVARCSGALGSMVELLSGRISREVMTVVTERGRGLFPAPTEIKMSCSCPDFASLCKHLAATLYGIGARLDLAPELLFALRQVDPTELIMSVDSQLLSSQATDQVLSADSSDLGALFGIDLESPTPPPISAAAPSLATSVPTQKPAKTSRTQSADKPAKKTLPTRKRASRPEPTAAESAAEQQVAALKTLLKRVKSPRQPAPA